MMNNNIINLNINNPIENFNYYKGKIPAVRYDKGSYLKKPESLPEFLDRMGLLNSKIRITSGYRKPGQAGKAGTKSNHTKLDLFGNPYAYDIVPVGMSFADLDNLIKENAELQLYLLDNNYRIIREDTAEAMAKYGSTGRHWHLSYRPGSTEGTAFRDYVTEHYGNIDDILDYENMTDPDDMEIPQLGLGITELLHTSIPDNIELDSSNDDYSNGPLALVPVPVDDTQVSIKTIPREQFIDRYMKILSGVDLYVNKYIPKYIDESTERNYEYNSSIPSSNSVKPNLFYDGGQTIAAPFLNRPSNKFLLGGPEDTNILGRYFDSAVELVKNVGRAVKALLSDEDNTKQTKKQHESNDSKKEYTWLESLGNKIATKTGLDFLYTDSPNKNMLAIIDHMVTNGNNNNYGIIDKKNQKLYIMNGNDTLRAEEITLGKNVGDGYNILAPTKKMYYRNMPRTTGAGIYNVKVRGHLPGYHNELMLDLYDGKVRSSLAIHAPTKDPARRAAFNNNNLEDNRLSYGCVSGNCGIVLDIIDKRQLSESTPIFILPKMGDNYIRENNGILETIYVNAPETYTNDSGTFKYRYNKSKYKSPTSKLSEGGSIRDNYLTFNFTNKSNKYSGEDDTVTTLQMDTPNIFRKKDGTYVYLSSPTSNEISVEPINTVFEDPSLWTYRDLQGRLYTPRSIDNNQGTITLKEDGPIMSAVNNYLRELLYKWDNNIPIDGKYTMPAIAAAAAMPLLGEAAYPILTNPYVDAGITSAFGAHGLNHAINEGVNGLGDAAMTAMEIAPLGRLVKPIYNTGKEALIKVLTKLPLPKSTMMSEETLANLENTQWYLRVEREFGKDVADYAVKEIRNPEFLNFFYGRNPQEALLQMDRFKNLRGIINKITGNIDEGKSAIAGSGAGIALGHFNRAGAALHDLDVTAYMHNASKTTNPSTAFIDNLSLFDFAKLKQSPIFLTIREAYPETFGNAKVVHTSKLLKALEGLNRWWNNDFKYGKILPNPFPDSYREGVFNITPMFNVSDQGANRVAMTRINGEPIDIFLSDRYVPTSGNSVLADNVLGWKKSFIERYKKAGKTPRSKDIEDIENYVPFSESNPVINGFGQSLYAPFAFKESSLIDDIGIPTLSPVETYPGSNLFIPSFMNYKGELKPLMTPKYWTDAQDAAIAKALNITPEEASSLTKKQWDAAIARDIDIGEIQRLRDLHFKVKAPNTKIKKLDGELAHVYHGTDGNWVSYDPTKFGTATDEGWYGVGLYASEKIPTAKIYGSNIMDLYVNAENPFTAGVLDIKGTPYSAKNATDRGNIVYYFNRDRKNTDFSNHTTFGDTNFSTLLEELDNADAVVYSTPDGTRFLEVVIPRGEQIKSADAITFDDNGIRIPLGERDNFNKNDIRYGFIPPIAAGLGLSLYNLDNQMLHSLGGPLKKFEGGGNTDDTKYQAFLEDLKKYAPNLAAPSRDYNMRRYWELKGKPSNWEEAQRDWNYLYNVKEDPMFYLENGGFYHATSTAPNLDTGIVEFMKSANHPTVQYELNWYDNGDETGPNRLRLPSFEGFKSSQEFKQGNKYTPGYELKYSPIENKYYYIPKQR